MAGSTETLTSYREITRQNNTRPKPATETHNRPRKSTECDCSNPGLVVSPCKARYEINTSTFVCRDACGVKQTFRCLKISPDKSLSQTHTHGVTRYMRQSYAYRRGVSLFWVSPRFSWVKIARRH